MHCAAQSLLLALLLLEPMIGLLYCSHIRQQSMDSAETELHKEQRLPSRGSISLSLSMSEVSSNGLESWGSDNHFRLGGLLLERFNNQFNGRATGRSVSCAGGGSYELFVAGTVVALPEVEGRGAVAIFGLS